MIEDSLLKRGPASPEARRSYPEELLDPAAFEERLREARDRRAIALATRAATGGGGSPAPMRATPPVFPLPAGALETEAPILAPPFARAHRAEAGGHESAPRCAAGPVYPRDHARAPRPGAAPRIAVTPESTTPPLWAPLAPALGVAVAFTRRHALPIVASGFVAGILFGAFGMMLTSNVGATPKPADHAGMAPPNTGEPGRVETAALLAVAPVTIPAASGLTTSEPTTRAPIAAGQATLETTASATLAEPTPDQMPSPEPEIIPAPPPASAALAREYLAARPLPRPAAVRPATATAEARTPASYSGTRVVINVPSGGTTENPDATEALITAAGFPRVELARTQAPMRTNQVRYFHAADADAAQALAKLTNAIARDFTTHAPPPKTGYLELWLAGDAPREARLAPAPEDEILGILRDRAARN